MNSNQGECKQGPQGSPWAPDPVQSRGLGQAPPGLQGYKHHMGGTQQLTCFCLALG